MGDFKEKCVRCGMYFNNPDDLEKTKDGELVCCFCFDPFEDLPEMAPHAVIEVDDGICMLCGRDTKVLYMSVGIYCLSCILDGIRLKEISSGEGLSG